MRILSFGVVLVLGSALIGCVAQADYDQIMVLNKSLGAEKVAAEQRALDAETQADALRNQMRIKEQELLTGQAMISNLRDENEHLDQAFSSIQDLTKNLNTIPDRPLIIRTPLPPALDNALRNFAASHPNAVEYDPTSTAHDAGGAGRRRSSHRLLGSTTVVTKHFRGPRQERGQPRETRCCCCGCSGGSCCGRRSGRSSGC